MVTAYLPTMDANVAQWKDVLHCMDNFDPVSWPKVATCMQTHEVTEHGFMVPMVVDEGHRVSSMSPCITPGLCWEMWLCAPQGISPCSPTKEGMSLCAKKKKRAKDPKTPMGSTHMEKTINLAESEGDI